MIAYFDCGTTNTRIYIINNGHIIYEKKLKKERGMLCTANCNMKSS